MAADPRADLPADIAEAVAKGCHHLRLLATTDLHMAVYPHDYYTDRPSPRFGLARALTAIRAARTETTLLLDNGDVLQGTPMGDAAEAGDRRPHPMIRAMNLAGYDAATVGNHEFNYGLDFLMGSLADASYPIVTANVVTALGATPAEDTTLLPPYTILERRLGGTGLRIGVIGFVPPQVANWDKRHLAGRVHLREIVEAGEAWVPRLRAEGVDLVIALCHSGLGAAAPAPMLENAAVPLAGIEGIDVLVTGHSHKLFPGPDYDGLSHVDAAAGRIHGKPAVMPGFWGSHLGIIDLALRPGPWEIAAAHVTAQPLDPPPEPAPDLIEALAEDHAHTLAFVRRPVGETTRPIQSYFSLISDDAALQIVSDAQMAYGRAVLAGTEHQDLPVLSATTPFKAGGTAGPETYTDIAAGALSLRSVADIYPFPNALRILRINGSALADWLERAAGIFATSPTDAADVPLLDPAFATHNFDVIDGVSYEIDLSQPPRFAPEGALLSAENTRIRNLRFNGHPVTGDMEFALVTNNYRADGGGRFAGAHAANLIHAPEDANQQILERYVAETGIISPVPDHNWRLRAVPGTSVLFETGPGARAHLDAVAHLKLTDLGDRDGFARFRLTL